MSSTDAVRPAQAALPPLSRDIAFHGMTLTQFLGAFNDNLFKQLVLLVCVDFLRYAGRDYQPVAMALFAIPFVMFSGFAGWVSDRVSKRQIIVLCKIAEIVVMGLGMGAFFLGADDPRLLLSLLFIVLFLMSTQSAFFGPGKYGILPEMLRKEDLPAANGIIQMTTFLAIIFGWALAGYVKEQFAGRLWVISAMCVGIAIVGTMTSLLVRRTPIALPGLPFRPSALLINTETWQLLRQDRALMGVLLVSSLFWFIGGVVQPAVNTLGKVQMQLGDGRTSLLGACMGVGIAIGCVAAGKLSHHRIEFRLVTWGGAGIVACLALVGLIGMVRLPASAATQVAGTESFFEMLVPCTTYELWGRIVLTALGFFAGLFAVPLQVFLQVRPPETQKGRVIGAMNLANWTGIVLSSFFLQGLNALLQPPQRPVGWIFVVLAVCMLPVALFYRPTDDNDSE